MSAPTDLENLLASVDARFAGIRARRDDCMECRLGCTDCCRCRLSITRVEEALLRRGLASLPDHVRREMKARAEDAANEMCPALDGEGRCNVYSWRPLACRSFGAPLRFRYPVPLIHPSKIDVCDKNFSETATASLPEADIIDQTELNEKLRKIDEAFCTNNGYPKGARVALAQILGDVRDQEVKQDGRERQD